MEKTKINYEWFFNFWKNFFLNKGFELASKAIYDDDYYGCFIGSINGSENVRIDVYSGNFKTNTGTHGCIGVDWEKDYNKLSQMPIHVDLDEDENEFWKAIMLLIDLGPNKNYATIEKNKDGKWEAFEF